MDVPFEIEIALEEAAHAKGLEDLGVHRIELCANLAEGGLTPTVGQALAVLDQTSLPVYAMLRPRAGNFCYSTEEKRQIQDDLEVLSSTGIQGVVFGALLEDGSLDVSFSQLVVKKAQNAGLGATFHRAIDAAKDPGSVATQLEELGVERLLTSGGAANVFTGLAGMEQFCSNTPASLCIQAGSGVHAGVAEALWERGVRAFHMTARTWVAPQEDPLGFDGSWHRDDHKIIALSEELMRLAAL